MEIATQYPINILNTNVEKNEMEAYDPLETYALGQKIQHRTAVFESLKDGNLGNEPSVSSLGWERVRTANYWALFDYKTESYTVKQDEIFYSFNTNDVNCVSLFGVEATAIQITLKDKDGNVVFNSEKDMSVRVVQSWYDWTFEEAEPIKYTYLNNLPMVYNGVLEIRVKNPNSLAKCKYLFFGRSKDYGLTLADNPSVEIYVADKEADNGETRVFKDISIDVLILENKQRNLIFNRLEKLIDKPIFVIGVENEESPLSALGEFKNLNLPISKYYTEYTLQIKGVISR